MRNKVKILIVIGMTVLGLAAFLPPGALAADVNVYLEGAYDDTYLDVYIYADFNVPAVISYGVRLEYDNTELTVFSMAKNDATKKYTSNTTVWALGLGTNKDNPDPVDTGSAVIFKGGILNEAAPTDGVTDTTRVFLGTVRFVAFGGGAPTPRPTLTLTYAENYSADPDSYKNFVRYDAGPPATGVVLDSADSSGVEFYAVNYSTAPFDIARRGDANGDGALNALDFGAIRAVLFGSANLKSYSDCNYDGILNALDFGCVKRTGRRPKKP